MRIPLRPLLGNFLDFLFGERGCYILLNEVDFVLRYDVHLVMAALRALILLAILGLLFLNFAS